MRCLSSLVLVTLALGAPAAAQYVKPVVEMPKPMVPIRIGGGATAQAPVVTSGGLTPSTGTTSAPTIRQSPAPVAATAARAAVPVMVVPPSPGARAVQLWACPVTSLDDATSSSCKARLIDASAVFALLHPCTDAVCYAQSIAKLTRAPDLIIVYPAEPAERAQVQQAIRREIAYAAVYMGEALTRRAREGDSTLPSVDEIEELAASARREVDAIDQPIDETPDQIRQRLGLGPAKRRMAAMLRA